MCEREIKTHETHDLTAGPDQLLALDVSRRDRYDVQANALGEPSVLDFWVARQTRRVECGLGSFAVGQDREIEICVCGATSWARGSPRPLHRSV